MTPNDIKVELSKRRITQAEIAELSKVSRQYVWGVINGRISAQQVRKVVAAAIEKPITEVFPDERFRRPSGRIRIPSAFFQQATAQP